jgi:hypothetical protein
LTQTETGDEWWSRWPAGGTSTTYTDQREDHQEPLLWGLLFCEENEKKNSTKLSKPTFVQPK